MTVRIPEIDAAATAPAALDPLREVLTPRRGALKIDERRDVAEHLRRHVELVAERACERDQRDERRRARIVERPARV